MKAFKFFKRIIYTNLLLFGIIKKKADLKFQGAWVAGDKELIKLGENVSFGGNVLLHADAEIEIGDNTMIAYETILYTATHDYNDHPMWYKKIRSPIKIGKHVWIGLRSIILPGVIVGDYSVIAAGSVVNANVPEGAIVAGNPARIIKFRDKEKYYSPPIIHNWSEGLNEEGKYCTEESKYK
jgi:acetyltransferase-like isoleucine patch superfamily enzyme